MKLNIPENEHPIFYISKSNEKNSLDDIEIMANNLAKEILDYIIILEKNGGINQLSFICHSLGGIIARQAVKSNHLTSYRGLFSNFCTFGSPHCSLLLHNHTIINSGKFEMILLKFSEFYNLSRNLNVSPSFN